MPVQLWALAALALMPTLRDRTDLGRMLQRADLYMTDSGRYNRYYNYNGYTHYRSVEQDHWYASGSERDLGLNYGYLNIAIPLIDV